MLILKTLINECQNNILSSHQKSHESLSDEPWNRMIFVIVASYDEFILYYNTFSQACCDFDRDQWRLQWMFQF